MSSEAEVKWSRDGQRFVHATSDATGYVRELFQQYGDGIADLEIRRATLEDTYMTLVREFESGRSAAALREFEAVTP
jgi:ABC-2 type transport system ATP-binding protein